MSGGRPTKGKQITRAVYMVPETLARLQAISERSHVPVSVFIREAVDKALPELERRLAAGLPLFDEEVSP